MPEQRLDIADARRIDTIGIGPVRSGKAFASIGGLLGAVAASSCCALPLVLFSLGAGGAWIGNLTALSPYQPAIVAVTIGFLGVGFWLVYRKPGAAACETGGFCAHVRSDRLIRAVLWVATVLVIGAVAFNFVAPLFLES